MNPHPNMDGIKAYRAANQSNPSKPKPIPKQSPLEQTAELQRIIMDSARNPDKLSGAIAQLARAHADIERLEREIRMQPKPAPQKVMPKRKSETAPVHDGMLQGPDPT